MASLSLSDFRVLVVPGLNNSGPQHWQSRWQRLYPYFERVEQDRWDAPAIAVWSQRLRQVLHQPKLTDKPVLVVAHSFGCLTTVHSALADTPLLRDLVAGALLVAPADPDKFSVSDDVHTPLPFPALLVASMNDPWMEINHAVKWSKIWGAEMINVGTLGHVNAESNLGDWLFGQALLQRLVQRINAESATSPSFAGGGELSLSSAKRYRTAFTSA